MTHVAIVGAYGSAGVAAAEGLIEEDVRLTLIDNGDPGGGLCILRGCMPSKEVLSATAHRYQARVDHRLAGPSPDVDLNEVVATKNEHVGDFAAHRRAAVHDLAEREGVEFIHDTARFVDDRVLRAGGREIEADYVVIATGSVVNVPELPGLEEVDYATSADLLDATALPDSAIVMGFGYVGLEMVPYLAESGVSEITVIEHDARPLDEADPEFGDAILDLYREEFGVRILTETWEERVEPTTSGVRLHTDRADEFATVEADGLYLFTGRRPNFDGLGLEQTSVEPGPEMVDATMRAAADERSFVVGDANAREPILHVAKEQGYVAAENILRHVRGDPLEPYENVLHHVVFSGLGVYPYVRLGYSEAAARAEGLDYVVATRDAADDGVFRTKDVPHGLAKLVVGTDGTVLGYQGLHNHADTMAKTMQVVIETGMDVRDVPARAFHPTLPEIIDGLVRQTRAKL